MKILPCLFLGLLLASPVQAQEESFEGIHEENHEIILSDGVQTQDRDYYYNFGGVRLFREARANFYLRNNTNIPIYINDLDLVGSSAFSFRDNCPRILFRGQQCRIRVFFQPRNLGQHRADLEIELTPQEDVVLHLRGRGVLR
ncbi:hypothetical protein EZJ49_14795 [Bdellovibrio bacteriovorus]|uniref:Ig-like domain-containing protein n=1 Tax=Bdellovibrio bacteriovorus TaxID=959 RepID=UPI0021D3A631|nr:hypothetical protein [Bdellovibrio bacteriovorus]UXR64334.1 hypothetical protein EZJ49_14795 [Bdellovibrio bacteriovorus]